MGMQIQRLRKAKGMTQSQLADALGYESASAIGMWESGDRRPPSSILPQLAKVLGCSIDDLYGDVDEEAG